MCLPGLLCCAGQAACCAGQACCSCLCGVCGKAGVPARNFSKLGYVFFQLFWMLMAITMILAKGWMDILPFIKCPNPSASGDDRFECLGPSAIIRISFVLTIFHTIVFIVILFRNDAASIFHDGCWTLKFLAVTGFFIGSLWINNDFFIGYMSVARYVSIPFLIIQAMLMLIVAYNVNDTLVGNYEAEGTDGLGCSGVIVIFVTGILTIGNAIFTVY